MKNIVLDALKVGGNNFIGADPTLQSDLVKIFQRNIPERQKLTDRSIKRFKMIRVNKGDSKMETANQVVQQVVVEENMLQFLMRFMVEGGAFMCVIAFI